MIYLHYVQMSRRCGKIECKSTMFIDESEKGRETLDRNGHVIYKN